MSTYVKVELSLLNSAIEQLELAQKDFYCIETESVISALKVLSITPEPRCKKCLDKYWIYHEDGTKTGCECHY